MSRLKKIDWTNLLFLILNPAVTFIALGFYLYYIDLSLATIAFALVFAIVTNLSITVGYHRHFAHKSFKTNTFVLTAGQYKQPYRASRAQGTRKNTLKPMI